MSNSSMDEDLPPAAVPEAPSDAATFSGDTGQLPLPTRRVLVQLLLGPSLDGTRHRHLWPVLLRDETAIRSRLHDLFLDLVLDAEQQIAFTRQVVAEDIDAPVLLRRANLTFIETALVLFLRQRLTQADAAGERAVVALDEMQGHLAVFERVANPDQARFGRQLGAAIEKVKKLNLVRLLPGGQQRFEVSPALKLLFAAETIEALTRTYEAVLAGGAKSAAAHAVDSGDAGNDDDDGESEES